MKHLVVSPIIGGLVVIIVAGLWMHGGALGSRSASYQTGCHFSMSGGSMSPAIVGAMIRHGVHC